MGIQEPLTERPLQNRATSFAAEPKFNKFESIGGARNGLVARLELVRHLFRRPLECWLLLDRALYLREFGYQVALARFCPRAVTPRNVLLTAQLPE